MKKKELIIISILTILLAFMDISGLPSALFINIEILDITPFYWTLMFNFIIIGVIAFFTLKYLCPNWKLGLNKKELKNERAPVRCLIYSRWKSYLVRSNQPLVPRFWSCNCEVTI